jgi:hypothetical protein
MTTAQKQTKKCMYSFLGKERMLVKGDKKNMQNTMHLVEHHRG